MQLRMIGLEGKHVIATAVDDGLGDLSQVCLASQNSSTSLQLSAPHSTAHTATIIIPPTGGHNVPRLVDLANPQNTLLNSPLAA
jgi:hypothetical protein